MPGAAMCFSVTSGNLLDGGEAQNEKDDGHDYGCHEQNFGNAHGGASEAAETQHAEYQCCDSENDGPLEHIVILLALVSSEKPDLALGSMFSAPMLMDADALAHVFRRDYGTLRSNRTL